MSLHCRIARITLLCAGLVAWAGAAPLQVLILSGANNHDWRATTPVLQVRVAAAIGAVSPVSSPTPK